MTLSEANTALEEIVERNDCTVYCKAMVDGNKVAIHLDGEFNCGDLFQIVDIASAINSTDIQ